MTEPQASHGVEDLCETFIPLNVIGPDGRRRARAWGLTDKVKELANPKLHNMCITTFGNGEEKNTENSVCTLGGSNAICPDCHFWFKANVEVTQAIAEAVLKEEHASELRMHPKEATERQILGTVGGNIECPRCYRSYYSKINIPKHVALDIYQYFKEQTEYEQGIGSSVSGVGELSMSSA